MEPRESKWRSSRAGAVVAVWIGALGWTAYLVMSDNYESGGTFGVILRVMGSIGILFGLFLVAKPRKEGILGIRDVREFELDARQDPGRQDPPLPMYEGLPVNVGIIFITVALALGAILYRLSQDSYLHQTSAFFIGIPAVLAITLAFTPRAKSATGMIVKGLTLGLLLSGVVLMEGFVCILMAAPIFYCVGIAIGVPIDRARKRKRSEGRVLSVVGVALLLMSAEGVTPATTLSQRERIEVTRTIDASVGEVEAALGSAPSFDRGLPAYLKLGFPRPVAAHGSGLEVGDRRTIVFGTESPMEPMDKSGAGHHHHAGPPDDTGGELVLEIVRSEDGRIVFEPVRDRTAFTHWITWGRQTVEWNAVDADTTQVTWTLQFERKLSPSWYFGPWQRYAGKLAAGYLIDTVATP